MTKRVIYEVSNYRMKIARIFMSASEIARLMGVSVQTIYRWEKAVTPMSAEQMQRLEDAIMAKMHEIHLGWGGHKDDYNSFGSKLKMLVTEALIDDAPDVFYIPDERNRKNSDRLNKLKDRLIFLLHGKRRRADAIKETLVEEGFSVAQIQRAANQLGVKKETKGFGPSIKSYWSLPA